MQAVRVLALMFLTPAVSFQNPFRFLSNGQVRTLHMTNTFGVQKLGEKIIGAPTVTVAPESDAPGIFRRGSVGSGRDERFSTDDLVQELEASQVTMIGIDKSFRQQTLLMTLSPDSILGFVDKAERVRLAANEGLLPMSFTTDNVATSSLSSGGLYKDWDFDM